MCNIINKLGAVIVIIMGMMKNLTASKLFGNFFTIYTSSRRYLNNFIKLTLPAHEHEDDSYENHKS